VVAVGAAVAPVSNLLPLTMRLSDRYLYLAMVMLALPVASALDAAVARAAPPRRRTAALVAGAIVAVVVAVEAWTAAELAASWHSSQALWARAARAQPRAFLARLKYAEVLEAARQWPDALAELRDAQQLNPGNPLPAERLIHLHAWRAELAGDLPAGTARRWLLDAERALTDRAAFQTLSAEIDAAPCRRCGDALAVIGVAAWPEPDAALLTAASGAIERHLLARARIYLARIRDRTSPEYARLARLAQRAPASELWSSPP
jgi:hypothetical protein